VHALFARAGRLETLVHGLEQRWPYALGALVVIAVFAWWAIFHGLPLAAEAIARQIPVRADAVIGESALAAIDRGLCQPSTLSTPMQERVQRGLRAARRGIERRTSLQAPSAQLPGDRPERVCAPGRAGCPRPTSSPGSVSIFLR
jgi:hypothetical protein